MGTWCAFAIQYGTVVSNCVIIGNRSQGYSGTDIGAGGVYIDYSGSAGNILANSVISNNLFYGSVKIGGGGLAMAGGGQVRNCLICNNTNMAATNNGGGVYLSDISGITNKPYGLINCTIVNNYSTNEGGGIAAAGTSNYVANCIVAYNSSFSNNYPNVYHKNNFDANMSNYYYCCVITAGVALLAANQGNVTNEPAFVDSVAGNRRLQAGSPCVNTGTNQSWMTNTFDLDDRARIRYGAVDMGAYETIYDGTVYRMGF